MTGPYGGPFNQAGGSASVGMQAQYVTITGDYKVTAAPGDPPEKKYEAGVRTERTVPPDPSGGLEFGSRRVDYVLSVPGNPHRWLLIAFSALGAGDPGDKFAGLLVELFDAIVSTFRWSLS